ncbi:MAG: TonB-dependent receptor [Salibacteraceae bacterium]
MFNKISLLLVTVILIPAYLSAQNCDLTISGYITDISTGTPIEFANVYSKEAATGAVTDSSGFFEIKNLCKGPYHISVSHLGCLTQHQFILLERDTLMKINLDHNSKLLNEVNVIGESNTNTTQEIQTLTSKDISQSSEKNLANMIEDVAGVSSIKNGSGISKPVVHGLYGNRLTILNNGVAQSGQQWGVDHSPEIDPLVANKIRVIKGVGALEYQGNSLGSVILVEPKQIANDPHLHGNARYFFESNGLGNGINVDFEQYGKWLAWRAVGTLKKSGDKKTPDYYLRNTGNQEANFALELEKIWNKKLSSDLYFSSYNAELGILRGSQVGNLTDLENAFERNEPYYTEDKFSYSIDAPYQRVNHHLIKFNSKFKFSKEKWLSFTYAGQYNLRKEFDIRRGGRTDLPSLSLEQKSNFIELKYYHYLPKKWKLKTGAQANFVDNVNNPETGILPLIPDYLSRELGAFVMINKSFKRTILELGVRYDFENRKVATISNDIPRKIVRYDNNYQNLSAVGGISHELTNWLSLVYNLGYSVRNPEVNELYSNGLHQGVGGIEEGNPNLKPEVSLKNTLSLKGKIKSKLSFETLLYYQEFENYIFLDPQDELRLTIRGAFPVFKYKQTQAQITGFDVVLKYQIRDRLEFVTKYSFLYGRDKSNDIPLINMPANRLYGELNFQLPTLGSFEDFELQLNNKYVFKQNNLLSSQDYLAAPEAYNLLGLKVSSKRQFKKFVLNTHLRVENLLNVKYRDYLNRQRYFADDLRINIIVGINLSF